MSRPFGAAGLKDASQVAVLNANYLLARLRALGVLELLPPAYDRVCMHEFVPLLVDEALLIEPTETETRETLDEAAAAKRPVIRQAL